MSEKIIKSRFSLTHDTYDNWSIIGNDFIPAAGEIIIYDANAENVSPRIKIGDGIKSLNDLSFFMNEIEGFATEEYVRNYVEETILGGAW